MRKQGLRHIFGFSKSEIGLQIYTHISEKINHAWPRGHETLIQKIQVGRWCNLFSGHPFPTEMPSGRATHHILSEQTIPGHKGHRRNIISDGLKCMVPSCLSTDKHTDRSQGHTETDNTALYTTKRNLIPNMQNRLAHHPIGTKLFICQGRHAP